MQITNNWISGFVDGDGCFNIQKIPTKNNKILLRHRFIISQDKKSVDVLYAVKKKFQCGSVYKSGGNMYEFSVSDKENLINIIIPFFIKYPLQSEKRKNFYKLVESINANVDAYKNFSIIQNENFNFKLNNDWVAGLIDADGCFYVSIVENYPRPKLFVGVHGKDLILLENLKKYLKCGTITPCKKKNFYIFSVSSTNMLITFIFPILFRKNNKNLLKTVKRISASKLKKIVFYISEKKHLTVEGMEKIQKLKNTMNTQR
jgi:hypothetical protein